MQTSSYSPKPDEHSEYYKTFSNIVTIRTVRAEYLIAMKLCAGRQVQSLGPKSRKPLGLLKSRRFSLVCDTRLIFREILMNQECSQKHLWFKV